MDSVMDISVFEVSITLFKRLYISILRGLEMQIVMDDRRLHKTYPRIRLHRVINTAASGYEYGCVGLRIWQRRVTDIAALGYEYGSIGLRIWLRRLTETYL